VGRPDFKSG